MLKVAFHKYVFDAKSDDESARFAVLSREDLLPFAPVPGHEIQWPLVRSQKILTSTWSTEQQGFRCRVEDEYTINYLADAPDFDECLANASEEGWAIAAVYPATK